MIPTPFHAYYKARMLETISGRDRLVPAYASANIKIYPYQIAAATFALRSPYLKGAILCDDGSLGKSYEALLIITERWYEGKRRVLIVVPTPLLHQWESIIDNRYSVPLYSIDNSTVFQEHIDAGNANPFEQDGVVITTYDFAAEKAEYISGITWDLSVFEEAHHLRRIYTGENKGASLIREAVAESFKLLLTATPMQNDIMDLYGLIYFIDESALPDADSFYKRYFRKPENYAELANRISKFCFRTTRPQVATYIKIPKRLPMTFDYIPTGKEQQLADMLDAYLARGKKHAFPKMELYDLTLLLYRTLSSSTCALEKTLQGVEKRLADMAKENGSTQIADEHRHIAAMLDLCRSITENAKGCELLSALKKGFSELKRLGAKRKAILFTENRETQKYLYDILDGGAYKGKVLMFNGEQSRDYSIIERFENSADILLTTDIAAEGFNLEFCSFVINYDLPYNTLKIEQRISRCHRQEQQSDVLVVNFLNRSNYADVRMLELINKRILQYDGIVGLSDDVIGSLNVSISKDWNALLATARTKDEIEKAFDRTLAEHEAENKQLVDTAEQSLFTLFKKEIADNVTVSPQYMEQRIREVNSELWDLAILFFKEYNESNPDNPYEIDEQVQTITATGQPSDLFYYWTGSRNKPYVGHKRYGIDSNFKPASGRITLSSIIGRGVLHETSCTDMGTLIVSADTPQCVIGLYRIYVKRKESSGVAYFTLVGKTADGRILTNDECSDIMKMPVVSYTEDGRRTLCWLRESVWRDTRHELDSLISQDEYIRRTIFENDNAIKEEIEHQRALTQDKKIALEREIEALRSEVGTLVNGLERASSIAEKIKSEKKKAAVQKELKQREQQLFLDGMRFDLELDEKIKSLTDTARYTATITRHFVLKVEGE